MIEIEDVGNHGRRGAGPLLEAFRGERADADVTDQRVDGGEGRLQDVGNHAIREPLALPPVVVVVADGGHAGLLDQRPKGHAQGQLHRYGPRVLDDQQLEPLGLDPCVEDGQELVGQALDLVRHGLGVAVGVERGGRHPRGGRMGEVHGRHQPRGRTQGVHLAGAQAHLVAHPLEDRLPLGSLEGHAVDAGQPGRDHPNPHVTILATIEARKGSGRYTPRAMPSLPIVAIVGRPNVGKSTLFNRMVGERAAIVEDTAGTTRDRVYGESDWNGRRFMMVDTGGLELAPGSTIEERVQDQAQVAIEEADVVLFVVDAAAGLAPLDHEVADRLRRAHRPTILVINKADNPRREAEGAEFYALGFDPAITISAQHGRNTGDLADLIVERLPPPAPAELAEPEPSVSSDELPTDAELAELAETDVGPPRVAIVGRPNTGKSTLVNRVLGHDRMIVSEVPGTTRDAVDAEVLVDGEPLILIDTAGIRRRGSHFGRHRAVQRPAQPEGHRPGRCRDRPDRCDRGLHRPGRPRGGIRARGGEGPRPGHQQVGPRREGRAHR